MTIWEKFARLDDYPVFFTINTLVATVECAKTNMFLQPTGYLPIIWIIMFFQFIVKYVLNPNIGFNQFKKLENYAIIGVVWFCCFFFQKMWVVRLCLTYKNLFYFIAGISLGKTVTLLYGSTNAQTQSPLLSFIVCSITGCIRELVLYVISIAIGGYARNPIPVAIASFIIMVVFNIAKKNVPYRSGGPVAIACLLFGLFFAYRANVSDRELMLF
jgi:hypothetical protein